MSPDPRAAQATQATQTTQATQADQARYHVVVNDEEQHSLWPARTEPPAGWVPTGFVGTRAECTAHIDRVWPDIRPLSLRRRLAGDAA